MKLGLIIIRVHCVKYIESSFFNHSQPDKIGLLITNLGTPDAPTPSALRRYLRQFLWDPRVVEVPRPLWWLILHGIILNIRPRRSAHAYQQVWTEDGSPLAVNTREQATALAARLRKDWGDDLVLEWGMRYGTPSIHSAIDRLMARGARKLLVLPLYPQYSGATGGSTFDAVAEDFTHRRWLPELRFINGYHDLPEYIEALATSIRAHWDAHGRPELLVFSYHGIPLRYLFQGDPYHCHCHKTTRLVAKSLGLEKHQYTTTFQSRFGREAWLRPYTDETLKALPARGIKHVQVLCPGFSSDCLETIEEIGMENRGYFMEAGGERYEYIRALNANAEHIEALAALVNQSMQGWRTAVSRPEDIDIRNCLYQEHEANALPAGQKTSG